MTGGTTDRNHGVPMRADARRNREQIIAAGREIFAERDVDAPMEEIARRAGVGVGTLYRRFPDRDALIEAVAIDHMRRLTELARSEWDETADAWSALRRFLQRCVELRLGWLHSALQPRLQVAIQRNAELRATRAILLELLDRMVHSAQEQGAMRGDVASGDVLLILGLVIRHMPGLSWGLADRARDRLVQLVWDGLGAQPDQALPGEAINLEELLPDELSPPA